MYLHGNERETFYTGLRDSNPPVLDGHEVTGRVTEVELAYWRKHWELHELIFGHFRDCQNVNDPNGMSFKLGCDFHGYDEIVEFQEKLKGMSIRIHTTTRNGKQVVVSIFRMITSNSSRMLFFGQNDALRILTIQCLGQSITIHHGRTIRIRDSVRPR